jgi:hypothetical protein
VADKGLTAYVKWKSAQVIENEGEQRTENGKVKMENGKRWVHPPGVLYESQTKRVTEFAIRK